MQSGISKNKHLIECSCGSYDHLFTFEFDKEFELIQLGIRYKKLSFWYRIKDCFNYLFKKENLFIEEIIIHSEDIKQMEELIVAIKKERAERLSVLSGEK